MGRFLLGLTAGILALGAPRASAVIGGLCGFEVYRPPHVVRDVTARLQELGMGVLGPEFPVAGLPAGRSNLFRGGAVVGQIAYVQDVRRGFANLAVFDARDRVLFEVVEQNEPCPPGTPVGRCLVLRLTTELNQRPLAAVLGPNGVRVHYFRFGHPVGRYDFHQEVLRALDWLQGTLTTTMDAYVPADLTPIQRLRMALASDPLIAPYLHRLTFIQGADRLWIKGVVPSNAVYSLILSRAREAGFLYAAPDMVIDTRTRLPPDLGPTLGRC